MKIRMKLVFPLLVVVAAGLAMAHPPLFLWSVSLIVPLLGIAMFGMGMTLVPEDFKIVLKSPRIILAGLLAQYAVMAGLAWMLAKTFNLPPGLAAGVILVGTSPGGTSSNLMTYIARGDVALSVAMTACSTLAAPLATPFLTLMLAGQWLDVNVWGMLFSIIKIVIIPVALGMAFNRFSGRYSKKAVKYVPLISMTAIIIIVGAVVALNESKLLFVAGITVAVVVTHNLSGLVLGYLAGRLFGFSTRQCRTLSLEVGLQNSGLSTSLAKIHFAAMPEAMIPAAIFSIWHNISGALLAGYWSGKPVKTEEKNV
ncbi:MAG: bile acid:sodium symporter family protein [Victivallaceae bacterium]|nr:bile acid:sodium symporter family protein [Victivallaceae bacterium]